MLNKYQIQNIEMDTTKLQKLIDNRVKVAAGGGEAAVEKHHA